MKMLALEVNSSEETKQNISFNPYQICSFEESSMKGGTFITVTSINADYDVEDETYASASDNYYSELPRDELVKMWEECFE